MTLEIDHVVIAGRDLDSLVAKFTALGLTPDPGGTHADGLTHNALIGFADGSYLELIAPVPGGTAAGHAWAEFMNSDAGVCAWAIRSDDIEHDAALYRSRGVTVGDPKPGGRNRPDGVRLEWITAQLGEEPLGSFLPFLIQDVTPRALRVPLTKGAEWVSGVAEIILQGRHNDPDRILSAFDLTLSNFKREFPDLSDSIYNGLGFDLETFSDSARLCGVLLRTAFDSEPKVRDTHLIYPFLWRGKYAYCAMVNYTAVGFLGDFPAPKLNTDLFKQRLGEVIAWCSSIPWIDNEMDAFRSSLTPPVETDHFVEQSEHYLNMSLRMSVAYDQYFNNRSQVIRARYPDVSPADNLAGGSLIRYFITNDVADGGGDITSNYYLSEFHHVPPWDTWIYYDEIEMEIIAWVPKELANLVRRGAAYISTETIYFLTGNETDPFVQTLKAAGFFPET